ncbi:HAD family hydrolase [Sporolactobacillus nakayamae]|uniref:Putative hydrolase of the HAD superfamily n=1 Tax=Sporolactobacillus nakayamae TaxID=269670 RepID=A0A1I2R0K2_9BACL|nr:HAD family hydrolase [Sporolactobacillus nakayamae]SFG34082.1 putative hydrolase of the HAD superfamily [Sporolactobacillus nakayamae]
METKEWIFFDLGSTLIDESAQENYIVRQMSRALATLGCSYSADYIRHLREEACKAYKHTANDVLPSLVENDEQYEFVRSKAVYLPEQEFLYPKVIELLSDLSARYHLGIIANQSDDAQERMKKLNIHEYFSVFALSGELGIKKPDARIFSYALEQAGCTPGEAYMVGDRLDFDIYPANKLRMKTIRVLQGMARLQKPKNSDYVPTMTVRAVDDLRKMLHKKR